MENKNGKGIFLGVVSVATLVVAIIGATFAFFSASTNSAENGVSFGSTSVENTLVLTDSSNLKSTLVPVASEDANFKNYVKLDTQYCVDDEGNGICSVYQFKVQNNSTVAQSINITLNPAVNGFDNLYYAVFNDADANITDHTVATAFTKDGTAGGHGTLAAQTTASNTDLIVTATRLSGTSAVNFSNALNTTLAANDSATGGDDEVTYTIVFWVQETQYDQNTSDGGKTFAATLNVTTANGTGGVTGVIATGSPKGVTP